MRKKLLLILLLMLGFFVAGCGGDGPITLLDDQGKEISFENREKPALVFFFTGAD